MLVRSVIEIVQSNGHLPTKLIEAGYRSSQYGLVVFILNDVTPQAVNLILDPVVATMPLSIPGVLYVKMADEQRVRDAVRSAKAVYFASRSFYRQATSYGAPPELIYCNFFSLLQSNDRLALRTIRLRMTDAESRQSAPQLPLTTARAHLLRRRIRQIHHAQ